LIALTVMSDRALPSDTSSIVDRLAVILHPERVAAVASVDERTVNAWIAGVGEPSPGSELALRLADEVVLALIDRMSPDAVYGWFGGENPLLGFRAPALVIREGFDDPETREAVLYAASAFLVD
jgi:hypothetical protein